MPLPLCEVRVFSRRYRYAGTLDVLGVWEAAGALIDYKTGHPADVAADLQTAAYAGALGEMLTNGDRADMLTFDPLAHRYVLDGERLPSVTQILQASGLINFSKIPQPILIAARDRGSAVHQAAHYYNEGDLDVAEFEQDFPEYLAVPLGVDHLSSGVRLCARDQPGAARRALACEALCRPAPEGRQLSSRALHRGDGLSGVRGAADRPADRRETQGRLDRDGGGRVNGRPAAARGRGPIARRLMRREDV